MSGNKEKTINEDCLLELAEMLDYFEKSIKDSISALLIISVGIEAKGECGNYYGALNVTIRDLVKTHEGVNIAAALASGLLTEY
jgi:hypothetical protein